MTKEDRNTKILLVIVIILVIGIGVYNLFFNKPNKKDEVIDTETISIVTNPSDFYTASSCVLKYLNYVASGNRDNIIRLLSSDYKNKNNITIENIDNFINITNTVYNFNARKMFMQQVGKNIYKYYIYGLISEEYIDYEYSETNFYIIVILDKNNGTFAIEPYNGEIFN